MGRRKKPTAFDCFAGCGGMTEGFKQAGYRVVGAIEIDADAVDVYKLNHRRTHVWQMDISKVRPKAILRQVGLKKGQLNLLGGCPPCQGFSTLRTKNGKRRPRDDRNDLIFQFKRLVLALKPKHVMLENVPRLERNWRMARFIKSLRRAGYDVKHDVLDVQHFGVPQRRRRVVLIASRLTKPVFAEHSPHTATVRDAIGSLPSSGKSGDGVHDLPVSYSDRVKKFIRSTPRDGGSRSAWPRRLTLECHKKRRGFHDIYGRMAWDKPAPTITTGCFNPSKGRFLHPSKHRAITMREAALLQSFPPTYKFDARLGKVKTAEMIGNALPPEFIRHHAQAILTSSKARKHGRRRSDNRRSPQARAHN